MNPPERIAILYPYFFSTYIRRSTPSVIGRLSAISCMTDSSSPFNKATRRVKLSVKSISPRMALSVMAFTSSPTPARIASSSITSVSIKVESISKQIRRRIRRYILSCWKEKSISCSLASCISRSCMAIRSFGVPRTENSIQARVRVSVLSSSKGIRPVRRLMASMFKSCSASTRVAAEIWRADSLRPNTVSI